MKLLNINEDVKLARTSLSPLNIDYANAILIYNGLEKYKAVYTAPCDGLLVASGFGRTLITAYIVFKIGNVILRTQSENDINISLLAPLSKNTEVSIEMVLNSQNDGVYFIPIK